MFSAPSQRKGCQTGLNGKLRKKKNHYHKTVATDQDRHLVENEVGDCSGGKGLRSRGTTREDKL